MLFLGDSITSDKLSSRKIIKGVFDNNVFDYAISCSRTINILALINDSLRQVKPDVVSILIGTNDYVIVDREYIDNVDLPDFVNGQSNNVAGKTITAEIFNNLDVSDKLIFLACYDADGTLEYVHKFDDGNGKGYNLKIGNNILKYIFGSECTNKVNNVQLFVWTPELVPNCKSFDTSK